MQGGECQTTLLSEHHSIQLLFRHPQVFAVFSSMVSVLRKEKPGARSMTHIAAPDDTVDVSSTFRERL